MESSSPTDPSTIDYARQGAEQVPRSRVLVRELPDGRQFVDPPLAGSGIGWRATLEVLMWAAVATVLLGGAKVVMRLPAAWVAGVVIGAVTIRSLVELRRWRSWKRHPTVIDVTRAEITVTSPMGVRTVVPMGQLDDIRAERPRRMFGATNRVSTLIVETSRQRLSLLQYRDYMEVKWLAGQIRLAARRPEYHSAEPAVRPDLDDRSGDDVAVVEGEIKPLILKEVRERPPANWKKALSRAYDELGCLASVVLLALVLAGVVFLLKVTGAIAICLQLGSDAYFRDGVRLVPDEPALLTNGGRLTPPFQALRVLMWFVLMTGWALGAFLAVVGSSMTWMWLRRVGRSPIRSRRG